MSPEQDIIAKLEGALAQGSADRCNDILWGIADLFVAGAAKYSSEEIAFFDEVLRRLTLQIELTARALLANRLAPIPNAPPQTIRALAFDDAVEVASPILTHSEGLDDATLVENARHKGQGHLLAISPRTSLSEIVTEVLVERGERDVLLSAVRNPGAKFSDDGFSILVQRSDDDDELTVSVGGRSELPRYLFRHLIEKASREVRATLEALYPGAQEDVRNAVADAANAVSAQALARPTRKPAHAEDDRESDIASLERFAKAGSVADVCSLLARLCVLPVSFVEQALAQRRPETLLVMARAASLSWPAVKSILMLRDDKSWADIDLNRCLASYERLKISTAQEILRFYRTRSN
jgi:uncharacterized protein (DUF2336 family)